MRISFSSLSPSFFLFSPQFFHSVSQKPASFSFSVSLEFKIDISEKEVFLSLSLILPIQLKSTSKETFLLLSCVNFLNALPSVRPSFSWLPFGHWQWKLRRLNMYKGVLALLSSEASKEGMNDSDERYWEEVFVYRRLGTVDDGEMCDKALLAQSRLLLKNIPSSQKALTSSEKEISSLWESLCMLIRECVCVMCVWDNSNCDDGDSLVQSWGGLLFPPPQRTTHTQRERDPAKAAIRSEHSTAKRWNTMVCKQKK